MIQYIEGAVGIFAGPQGNRAINQKVNMKKQLSRSCWKDLQKRNRFMTENLRLTESGLVWFEFKFFKTLA